MHKNTHLKGVHEQVTVGSQMKPGMVFKDFIWLVKIIGTPLNVTTLQANQMAVVLITPFSE